MSHNFGLIGAGAYIAPRHVQAIKDTGNELVAALDPHDGSVGMLDSYFLDCQFFTIPERFDRYLWRLQREGKGIDWLSVCSPSWMHDSHCMLGLRYDANVICEKPLTITPYNLDALQEFESRSNGRVYTLMQLRFHPEWLKLQAQYGDGQTKKHKISLKYVTSRGPWYSISWKGQEDKSGGVITNIGIHFLDALMWVFGNYQAAIVEQKTLQTMSGKLELERAEVDWLVSTDPHKLPEDSLGPAYRSLVIDGEEIEFSDGFRDLHTRVYEQTLAGKGIGIEEARPSIELAYELKNMQIGHMNGIIRPYHKISLKSA